MIERINGEFITPVLNEWRYATFHFMNVVQKRNFDEEFGKANNHFRRAYYDSSEILIEVLLSIIKGYISKYAGYQDVILKINKNYQQDRETIREIKRWLNNPSEELSKNREKYCDTISEKCRTL